MTKYSLSAAITAYLGCLASLQWHISTVGGHEGLSPWHRALVVGSFLVMIPPSIELHRSGSANVWRQLARGVPRWLGVATFVYSIGVFVASADGLAEIHESHPMFGPIASAMVMCFYSQAGGIMLAARARYAQDEACE